MDFVSPERRMEGIALECLPSLPDGGFLRRSKPVKISPKFLNRPILITHEPGGVLLSAVSIETKRPFSKSSRASMKSWGISTDRSSRMRCTRCSRSWLGSASISLMICSAVMCLGSLNPLKHLWNSSATSVAKNGYPSALRPSQITISPLHHKRLVSWDRPL